MSLPRSVAEILAEHVTFELEGIDRMYLNAYVPRLQHEKGVVHFFVLHRGKVVASSALMNPITKKFVADIEAFAQRHDVPLIRFEKGQRKDDIAKEYLAELDDDEGVMFIGKAQEKASVFRTVTRHNPETGRRYPALAPSTAIVNHYYFYCVDRDFGPFFLKHCSYLPYTAKLCFNGHEYLKRQPAYECPSLRRPSRAGAPQRAVALRPAAPWILEPRLAATHRAAAGPRSRPIDSGSRLCSAFDKLDRAIARCCSHAKLAA